MKLLKPVTLLSVLFFSTSKIDAQPASVADLKGQWIITDTTEGRVTVDFGSDSAMKFEIVAPGMPAINMEGKYWMEFKSQLNLLHFVIQGHGGTQRTCQILKPDGDNQIMLQDASCTAPVWKADPEETEVFRRVGK